ncbi:MAG: hypothetical protein EPO23_14825 [Xanthobacteraceae bacterium]|nr:MAG: hypothetical protein EPO23_14825 [Xanthobacteraceae bacterium]
MVESPFPRPRWALAAALFAVIFGIATLIVGGLPLFGGAERRASAGAIVPFVLWFNFTAGFAYIAAGVGLFLWKRWAAVLAAAIAIASLAVFAAFGVHVARGGAFEMRTVVAMTTRCAVWIVIAFASCRALGCRHPARDVRR